jgi:hypothetical protein
MIIDIESCKHKPTPHSDVIQQLPLSDPGTSGYLSLCGEIISCLLPDVSMNVAGIVYNMKTAALLSILLVPQCWGCRRLLHVGFVPPLDRVSRLPRALNTLGK